MSIDKENSFLGVGWSFPPTFVRETNSALLVAGEVDVRESLWTILSTSLGERVMLPEFGSQLFEMVFESATLSFETQLEDAIRTAILNWEPRVDVNRITVQANSSLDGVVMVEVDYTIVQINTRSNLVFPFNIQEGTIPLAVQ